MALYPPPSKDLGIFDNSVFIHDTTGSSNITPAYLDEHYLKYPNAQGTENLQITNVNGLLSANNGLKIADGLNITNIDMNVGELLFNNTPPSGTIGTYKFRCNDSSGTVHNPFEIRPNTINEIVDTLNESTITTNMIASTAINMKAPTTKIETSTGVNGLLITPTAYTSYGNNTTMRDSSGAILMSVSSGTSGAYYASVGNNGFTLNTTGNYLSSALNHTFRNGLTNIMTLSTSNIVGTANTITFNSSVGNPVMTLSASGSTITGQNLTLTTTDGLSIKDSVNTNNNYSMDMSGNNFISVITPDVGGGEGIYKFRARNAGTTIYTPLEVKQSNTLLTSDLTTIDSINGTDIIGDSGNSSTNIKYASTGILTFLNDAGTGIDGKYQFKSIDLIGTTYTPLEIRPRAVELGIGGGGNSFISNMSSNIFNGSTVNIQPSGTITIGGLNTTFTTSNPPTITALMPLPSNSSNIVPTTAWVQSVISSLPSSSPTITDINTSGTYYPVFVAGSGTQNLLADITTNPFSINPNTGDLKLSTSVFVESSTNKTYLGTSTGLSGSNIQTTAIGFEAGNSSQGIGSTAIGYQAGLTSQGTRSVAVGWQSGGSGQYQDCVAIGYSAGTSNQGTILSSVSGGAVAIGYQAGQFFQGTQSVAIGAGAGKGTSGVLTTYQQERCVAIGPASGAQFQQKDCVAIGYQAGQIIQGFLTNDTTTSSGKSIAIGTQAGQIRQEEYSTAIGYQAGQTNQKQTALAIGYLAGNSNQSSRCVGIGQSAGQTSQGFGALAVGWRAGVTNQAASAIAIGSQAGEGTQGQESVAIGPNAGKTNQSTYSVAIGSSAGSSALGSYSIAIGYLAGQTSQITQSICLNASGAALNPTTASLYVRPIRNFGGTPPPASWKVVYYNPTTYELIYGI
jgi:hypothetical protein